MLAGRFSALAGAIGWATSGVVIKTVSPAVTAVQISAVYSWVALAMVLPVVALAGRLDDLIALPARSAALLIAASALYTVSDLAFLRLLSMGAVGWTFVTTTSLFILLSLVAGIVLLGDSVTWTASAGAAAIVGGIYLLNRRRKEKELKATAPADGASATVESVGPRQGFWLGGRLPISAGIAFLWTAGLLLTDVGVEDADPFAAAALIGVVPAAAYALLATRLRAVRIPRASTRNWIKVLASALAFGASAVAFTYALKFESAGITAVLVSSSPLFAVVLAAVFLKERMNATAVAGVALCLAGIAAVLVR
ncbi:MAG: DMT family transporter [Chloroflexi bacterium]|nr:DMT family transporter [Chloroflexota bacterium]